MAKFKIRRKLYNEVQQEEEYQQPVQQPVSSTGQELRSAAIGTLAPMAITGAVNAFSGASKKTKAAMLGTALTAGLGYAAHKGYLGAGAQNLTNKVVDYGKNLVNKVKAIPQQTAEQQKSLAAQGNGNQQPQLVAQQNNAVNQPDNQGQKQIVQQNQVVNQNQGQKQGQGQSQNQGQRQNQGQGQRRRQNPQNQGQQRQRNNNANSQGQRVTVRRKQPQQNRGQRRR